MLCRFANEFPNFVSGFLGRERLFRRNLREETVTDVMMASLGLIGGGSILVDFPDEPRTGADMQWDFVNLRSKSVLRLMIQAKRASGRGKVAGRHSYKHIDHEVGGVLQSKTLCDNARSAADVLTIPLYLFYHSSHTCTYYPRPLLGANLACGKYVHQHIVASKKAGKCTFRQIHDYEAAHFPLSKIFCPAPKRAASKAVDLKLMQLLDFINLGAVCPTPQEVLAQLATKIEVNDNIRLEQDVLPHDIQARIYQSIRASSDIPFERNIPTVTFISA